MANQNYSPAAVIIHWLIAVCIFFLFASSSWMLALPLSSDEFPFRQFPFQLAQEHRRHNRFPSGSAPLHPFQAPGAS